MSKLYATLTTDWNRKTTPTARAHKWIGATVQSFEGSIRTTMEYQEDGDHTIEITHGEDSTAYPRYVVFTGRMSEYIRKLKA